LFKYKHIHIIYILFVRSDSYNCFVSLFIFFCRDLFCFCKIINY